MRCPECERYVGPYSQRVNKYGTEVKRMYFCKKCERVFYTIERIVEEQKSSKIIIWSCNEYIRKTYRKLTPDKCAAFIRSRIQCNDGFSISIQASSFHYCNPRRTFEGPYTELELGYPSCSEELLMPYIENDSREPEDTVYPYVPVEVVDEMIQKHGGIIYDTE